MTATSGHVLNLFSQAGTSSLAAVLLGMVLAAACWTDLRAHRIPNWLVALGMIAGILCNAWTAGAHVVGAGRAVAGLLTGLAIFLPLYLARGMGAGDVKLMASVGAFLGPVATINTALVTLVAGGILAAAVVIRNGTLRCALENIRFMLLDSISTSLSGQSIRLPHLNTCAGKIPYALAIAVGTFVHVIVLRHGQPIVG
jgi:prepilin peptidase CpaA